MHATLITEHTGKTDGHATFYFAAGPADGPLLIFLHGLPELAISWHHQLPVSQTAVEMVHASLRLHNKSDTVVTWSPWNPLGDHLCQHVGAQNSAWCTPFCQKFHVLVSGLSRYHIPAREISGRMEHTMPSYGLQRVSTSGPLRHSMVTM